jgi:hypothetical protein
MRKSRRLAMNNSSLFDNNTFYKAFERDLRHARAVCNHRKPLHNQEEDGAPVADTEKVAP